MACLNHLPQPFFLRRVQATKGFRSGDDFRPIGQEPVSIAALHHPSLSDLNWPAHFNRPNDRPVKPFVACFAFQVVCELPGVAAGQLLKRRVGPAGLLLSQADDAANAPLLLPIICADQIGNDCLGVVACR